MAFGFSLGEKMNWGGNPLYDALSSRRNALIGLGAGIASGDNWNEGIGQGLQLAADGAVRDDAYALLQEEKAAEQETLNKTTEWLRQNGHANLLAAVESGAITPGDAWAQALAPASGGPSPIEINGQLVDPMTGQVIGDYRDPQTGPNLSGLPSEYQTYLLSQQDPGFAQFRMSQSAAPKPPTEAERKAAALTTVTEKDASLLFGDGTTDKPGIFDALGGTVDQSLQVGGFGVNPLAGFASSDYKVATDAISNITQSYLYAMSGATAPPEEVKKIALQVTPQPFDSPAQKKAKRDRLLAMYQAIEGAQGNAAPGGQWVDAGNGVRVREIQ